MADMEKFYDDLIIIDLTYPTPLDHDPNQLVPVRSRIHHLDHDRNQIVIKSFIDLYYFVGF